MDAKIIWVNRTLRLASLYIKRNKRIPTMIYFYVLPRIKKIRCNKECCLKDFCYKRALISGIFCLGLKKYHNYIGDFFGVEMVSKKEKTLFDHLYKKNIINL